MVRRSLSPFGGSQSGDPFFSLQREMNRLFDDAYPGFGVLRRRGQAEEGGMVQAHMNVSETEKQLRITAELPGVDEKDVEVTLEGDVLTIRGEKRFEQERGGEKENYHFVERSYGSFQRSVQLPYPINPEEIRAEFRNGVLSLTIPKSEHQQRRRIPIGSAGARQQHIEAEKSAESPDKHSAQKSPPAAGEQPGHH